MRNALIHSSRRFKALSIVAQGSQMRRMRVICSQPPGNYLGFPFNAASLVQGKLRHTSLAEVPQRAKDQAVAYCHVIQSHSEGCTARARDVSFRLLYRAILFNQDFPTCEWVCRLGPRRISAWSHTPPKASVQKSAKPLIHPQTTVDPRDCLLYTSPSPRD